MRGSETAAVGPAANTTVDLLICYSPEMATFAQNTLGMSIQAYMASLINATNGYYANSDVQIRLNLASSLQINYDEKTEDQLVTALFDISDSAYEFSVVPAERDRVGADLVVWLQLSYDDAVPGGARVVGIGWRPYVAVQLNPYNGYSVTSHWWLSQAQETFAHEIGHNMTLGHSYDQDNGGAMYYSHGWGHYTGPDPDSWYYGTVMTYASVAYPYFSNPNKTVNIGGTDYALGEASGVRRAEAWLALNNIRDTIAGYKQAPPPSSAPGIISATPDTGTGWKVTFTAAYQDQDGAADLKDIYFLVNDPNTSGAWLWIDPVTGRARLRNSENTGWARGWVGAGTIANSQVTVDLSQTSLTMNGDMCVLTVRMNFKRPFSGWHALSMKVRDDSELTDGWRRVGEWTVP